jgi:hypothetical protein
VLVSGATGHLLNNPGQTNTSNTQGVGNTSLFSQPTLAPGSLGAATTSPNLFNNSQQFSFGGRPQSTFFNNSITNGTKSNNMVSQKTPSMFSCGTNSSLFPNNTMHGGNTSLFSTAGFGNGLNTNVGVPTTTFSLGVSSVARGNIQLYIFLFCSKFLFLRRN